MFDHVLCAVEAYFTQEGNNGTNVGGEVGNRFPGTEGGPCYQMQLKKGTDGTIVISSRYS